MNKKQTIVGSKLFNFRLFLEALKRLRVIGTAVAILALTIAFLVPTVTWISEENRADRNGEWVKTEIGVDEEGFPIITEVWEPKEITPQPVEQYLLCLPLYITPFLSPLFFFVLFSFLHKRKESDFYHAIPYTRTCVYLSFISAALIFVLLLNLVSALISGMIYAACPYTTFRFADLASVTATSTLSAAFLSSFMMLSLTLTGTSATASILFVLFATFVRIVLYLFSFAIDNLRIVSASFYPYLSFYWYLPVRMFAPSDYYYASESIPTYLQVIPYTVIVTVAIFVLAGFFYKIRRSEMAERSAPSRLLQSIFRCLFTLPFALLLTTLIITDEIEFESALVLLAVILVVFYLYELITTKRPKNMLKATPWLGVVLAGALVFTLSYVTFYYTVHREIPAERIDAVKVDTEGRNTFESLSTEDVLTNDDRVVSLVSNALSYTRDYALHGGEYNADVTTKTVTLKLRSGITVRRNLRFTSASADTLEKCLTESDEYLERLIALPDAEDLTFLEFYPQNTKSYDRGVYLSSGDRDAIRVIWESFYREFDSLSLEEKILVKQNKLFSGSGNSGKEEAEEVKIPDFPEGTNISVTGYGAYHLMLRVEGSYNGTRFYSYYPIPASMTKTLALASALPDEYGRAYYEFYASTLSDENGHQISLSTSSGDSSAKIAYAVAGALAEKKLSFRENTVTVSPYGGYELSAYLGKQEEKYTEFFSLIRDYAKTKTEPQDGTTLVTVSIDANEVYENSPSFTPDAYAYAHVSVSLHLTEAEYDDLLFALGITPFE